MLRTETIGAAFAKTLTQRFWRFDASAGAIRWDGRLAAMFALIAGEKFFCRNLEVCSIAR
jgi:hypothetical protein